MIDTKPYIDQLDILKEYIKYWVEFKDKERVREENIPKNAVKMGIGFIVSTDEFSKNITNSKKHAKCCRKL